MDATNITSVVVDRTDEKIAVLSAALAKTEARLIAVLKARDQTEAKLVTLLDRLNGASVYLKNCGYQFEGAYNAYQNDQRDFLDKLNAIVEDNKAVKLDELTACKNINCRTHTNQVNHSYCPTCSNMLKERMKK